MGCRCTGHCCERFNLQFSYEEMQLMKESILDGTFKFTRESGETYDTSKFKKEEVFKVADMIIPLGKSYLDHNNEPMIAIGGTERTNGVFDPKQMGEVVVNEASWFTCKHFDTETRNCTNYENRPNMCKNHPGHEGCNYKACTYKLELPENP